jgi:cytochrome c oxidase subunit 2
MSGVRRRAARVVAAGFLLSLSGCERAPSMLEPAGPAATRIEGLWWLIFWIATVVFVIVCGFLVVAIVRGRKQEADVRKEVRWGEPFIVLSGVVLPSAILIGVFSLSLGDIRALSRTGEAATLQIEVTGHDWWWEARYPNGAVVANEIHIPVGQPVRFRLETADVIHSFWVPRLQAKTDMITGRVNHMWLEAATPGRYRGQCAEFCGLQHANMVFFIVAQPQERFDAWVAQAAQPAAPATGSAAEGREVFLSSTCVGCHAIKGTSADATIGPDLTHVAQRRTLFAGTVANTPENLEQIIVDPQSIKPGAAMPPTQLSPEELSALVDYLEGLE